MKKKRPSPCDLRDSGEIEQNCSKLILMWCIEKNFNEFGAVQSKTVGVDVALNRRGRTGVTLFNFNGNYMTFTELDRKYEDSVAPARRGNPTNKNEWGAKVKRDWRPPSGGAFRV